MRPFCLPGIKSLRINSSKARLTAIPFNEALQLRIYLEGFQAGDQVDVTMNGGRRAP